MKTAVEWMVEQLRNNENIRWRGTNIIELGEQAKEMEKEKQKYFFDCGRQYQLTGEGTFTQVYNETYGGD
jgi:hypothetical protein